MGLLEGFRLVTVSGPGGAGKTRLAGEVLGADRARAAHERGAGMSLVTIAEYALMLAAPAPQAAEAARGSGKLSARERELVALVAQGRTNAPDRRAAVQQRPHGRLAPGADPR